MNFKWYRSWCRGPNGERLRSYTLRDHDRAVHGELQGILRPVPRLCIAPPPDSDWWAYYAVGTDGEASHFIGSMSEYTAADAKKAAEVIQIIGVDLRRDA